MSLSHTPKHSTPSTDDSASLHSLLETYVRYYATGPSHTARAKRLDIKHFLSFMMRLRGASTPAGVEVRDWTHENISRFVDELLRSGAKPSTVSRRLATLKHAGRILAERVAGFTNAARDVKPPRVSPLAPKSLSSSEIARVREEAALRRAKKPTFIRLRNFTLLELLLDTGIRADEARLLTAGQLDESLEWLKDVRTKGRKFRNVYITSAMRPALAAYLEARRVELLKFFPRLSKKTDGQLPVFVSIYGAKATQVESFRMGAKSIWRAVHELCSELGLHPHLFRHSFASELLNHTGDIRLVAQALGHSDIRVTMRYTERTDKDVALALEDTRRKRK